MTLEMEKATPLSQSPLLFEKRIVAELSENELMAIDGGSGLACVAATIALVKAGYDFGQWLAQQNAC